MRSRKPLHSPATPNISWSRTSSTTPISSSGIRRTHASYFKKLKDAVVINIPKLNEMAYEQVELASVPFLTFVSNKDLKGETANYSFVLRGYVRHWLGNFWAEYDRVKLLDLFDTTVEATPVPARAHARRRS